jgi:alkylation response protein AidB-like acyl-CoA dehydrogenase
MGIDFRLSDDQIALRDGARAFARGVLKDVRATIRKYAEPDQRFYAIRPFHKQGVDTGFVKGLFPRDVGGMEISTLDFAIAAEELCVVDVNVPSAMLGTGLCVKPVIMFGTDEQKQRFLPDFIEDGSLLGALAFTEVTQISTPPIRGSGSRPSRSAKAMNGSSMVKSTTPRTAPAGTARIAISTRWSAAPTRTRTHRNRLP